MTDSDAADFPVFARAIRRRWPTGVAVVTTITPDGDLRGVTVGSLMMVSLDPPTLAIGLSTESSFHTLLREGVAFAIAIFDRSGEFLADRFAGRAPVPDARFSGVPHTMVDVGDRAIPVLSGSSVLGWAACRVISEVEVGDHSLVLAEIVSGGIGEDTDDPLLFYEGHYRGLEVQR